eukprot:2307829-Amphidinium_carterae.1
MASLAMSSRSASASLFVDVSAAFDSVPHPVLWGAGANWDGTSTSIERSGYSSVSAEALVLFLHQHPSLLTKVGIPPSLVELLRMWGSSSWLVSDPEQSSAWRPHTGVPQGHNLAALIFDLFYSAVMAEID